jgi:hypothetical protein
VALAALDGVRAEATMTLSDPLIGLIIFAWGGMILVLLWHSATELKAIRTILSDIANATRATPAGLGSIQTSAHEARETNRLLKLAIKKQWGSAIDLERFP